MEVTCGGIQVKRRVGSYTNAWVAQTPLRTQPGGHLSIFEIGEWIDEARTGSFQITTRTSASLPITATCSGSSWSCPSQIKYPNIQSIHIQAMHQETPSYLLDAYMCYRDLSCFGVICNSLALMSSSHSLIILFRCLLQASFDVHTQPVQ